jgi:uncharacterized protein
VVENKQWSRADLADVPYRLVTVDGWDNREWLHPQEQARGYVEYLQDFNKFVQAHPAAVRGMVFLHNGTSASVASLRAPELADLAPVRMFTADDRGALRRFLRSRFAPSAAPEVADDSSTPRLGRPSSCCAWSTRSSAPATSSPCSTSRRSPTRWCCGRSSAAAAATASRSWS